MNLCLPRWARCSRAIVLSIFKFEDGSQLRFRLGLANCLRLVNTHFSLFGDHNDADTDTRSANEVRRRVATSCCAEMRT